MFPRDDILKKKKKGNEPRVFVNVVQMNYLDKYFIVYYI